MNLYIKGAILIAYNLRRMVLFMLKKLEQYKGFWYMIIGLMAVSLIALPYFVLGEGSYIQLHDQMDGEILNYIYQAKCFMQGNIVPEFMNGMDKCAMLPPAPFGVLFYLLMSPFEAFAVMQLFLLLVGFLSMYILSRKLNMHTEVCLAVAVLYCFLPFYPTYGLASLGQPMLVLAVLYLLEEGHSVAKKIMACGMIGLYAGFSSLALIGFVWIVTGGILTLWQMFKKRMDKAFWIGLGAAVMCLVYMLTNLDLFKSVLGISGFVSHRQEMVVNPTLDLLERAKSLLFVGGPYSNVYSAGILVAAVFTLLTVTCIWAKHKGDRVHREGIKKNTGLRYRQIIYIMCFLALGIVWAVLWNSEAVLTIRNAIGGMITYFHADRVSWIFPFMWVMILACVLDIWMDCFFTTKRMWLRVVCCIASVGLCLIQGAQEFRDGTLNKNVRLMFVDDYQQITWESFYMEEVFEEMKDYMEPDTSSYSVVSLGIYPSVALYNGFTCADGYSNNYDLAYKHEFVKIMEAEMAKNKEAEALVKSWGNRLYLISGEYGLSPLMGKESKVVYSDISLDTEAMKALNIRYLLSAGPITNASELDMELVRPEPFVSDSSYYEIWLYEMK